MVTHNNDRQPVCPAARPDAYSRRPGTMIVRYALERRQFGEPLASFQVIQQRRLVSGIGAFT